MKLPHTTVGPRQHGALCSLRLCGAPGRLVNHSQGTRAADALLELREDQSWS
jgi:hypothetical protein